MQTVFTEAQLADSQMAVSERILRSCVHCGFCTATCPTYVLEGDELDSPRGRIYLIKEMFEQGRAAPADIVTHVDRCLSCLSCMTTCPSGVDYMHLVDHARAHIEATYQRPIDDRAMRSILAAVLPYPHRFALALRGAALARPVAGLLKRVAGPARKTPRLIDRLVAMLSLAPNLPPAAKAPVMSPAQGKRRGRVALLKGCAQEALNPRINEAAVRLLTRNGIEVVQAQEEGCCGALVHHMGKTADALDFARANVDAWMKIAAFGGLDAILVTASGCGTTLKDYGFMLREDPAYAKKAAKVSALAKDVCEYVAGLDPTPVQQQNKIVAYHAACSLQHGQKITDQPKRLLKAAGFRLREVPEGHICCGSAGTYNIMQPYFAERLRDRKIANIESLRPDIIALGNIGCMMQIAGGTDIPVVHTIELLDWANGGPMPLQMDRAGA
jgi:glycolate oxidase iron-sulfur subunit